MCVYGGGGVHYLLYNLCHKAVVGVLLLFGVLYLISGVVTCCKMCYVIALKRDCFLACQCQY